jgi:hypothetical protein
MEAFRVIGSAPRNAFWLGSLIRGNGVLPITGNWAAAERFGYGVAATRDSAS